MKSRVASLILVLSFILLITSSAVAAVKTETLALKRGTNFISIPLKTGSGSVTDLFDDWMEDIEYIMYFDSATGQWLQFSPNSAAENSLWDMPDGAAFFIKASKDTTVSIVGDAAEDLGWSLTPGWNAFGVASSVKLEDLGGKIGQFNPQYDRVYKMNDTGSFEPVNAGESLLPGKGYWLDNDPDEDGVSSADELKSYAFLNANPLVKDLMVSPDKSKVVKIPDQDDVTSLKSECNITFEPFTAGKTTDEELDSCRKKNKAVQVAQKIQDLKNEYIESGPDIQLGGFKLTNVRYKANQKGEKIAGIALLSEDNFPPDLKGLLSLEKGSALAQIYYRSGIHYRAVAEELEGIIIARGGVEQETFKGENIEYLDISEDGSIEATVKGDIDQIAGQLFFIQWMPPDKLKNELPVNYTGATNIVKVGMPLGERTVVYGIWEDNAGIVSRRSGNGKTWFLSLPAEAEGIFEPAFQISSGKVAAAPGKVPDNWIPVDYSPAGGKPAFTGAITEVSLLKGLHFGVIQPLATDKITVDSEGAVEMIKSGLKVKFDERGLSFGDTADIFRLIIKGWDLKPDSLSRYDTRPALLWQPAVTLRVHGESDSLFKSGTVEGSIEVQLALGILEGFSKGADVAGLVKSLVSKDPGSKSGSGSPDVFKGWKAGLLGEVVMDLGPAGETALSMEADWSSYLKSSGDAGKDYRASFGYKADLEWRHEENFQADIKIAVEADESWSSQDGILAKEADKRDYKGKLRLLGEGSVKMPDGMPVVGGQTLQVDYLASVQYVSGDAGNRNYTGKATISARLNGADYALSDGGWRLKVDEIRIELMDVYLSGVKSPSNLMALGQFIKDKQGREIKSVTFQATLIPDAWWNGTFGEQGPYSVEVVLNKEKSSDGKTTFWAMNLIMDFNARWYFGDKAQGDKFIQFTSLNIAKKFEKQGWNKDLVIMGEGMLKLEDKTASASAMYMAESGEWMIFSRLSNMTAWLKDAEVMFTIYADGNGKKQLAGNLGARVSTDELLKELMEALGRDVDPDKRLLAYDLLANGSFNTEGDFSVELRNIPLSLIPADDAPFQVEKVKTVTFVKKRDGSKEFRLEIDAVFPSLAEEGQPVEQWPRMTLGGSYGDQGLFFTAQSIPVKPDLCARHDGAVTIKDIKVGWATKQGEKKIDWQNFRGELAIKLDLCSSWKNAAKTVVVLPDSVEARGEVFKIAAAEKTGWGYLVSAEMSNTPTITVLGDMKIQFKKITLKKASPWTLGLNASISKGDIKYDGNVGFGQGGLKFSLPQETALKIPLPGGVDTEIKGLSIDLGPSLALSGDVSVTIPDGNPVRGILGEKFSAKLNGSASGEFAISTASNISLNVNMGSVGDAGLNISSFSVSSKGSFAGAGKIRLRGRETDFVIGMQGSNVFFTADFGEQGIDVNLANLFLLKIKNKIGIKTLAGLQMVEINDMAVRIGREGVAALAADTQRLFYFLPTSVPPVGFAFFDNLQGNVQVAGFAVNVGVNFPAPNENDLKTLVQVVASSFGGGQPDWQKLGTLSAPALGLHDVYLKFPKVPGYEWKNGALEHTDNVFAGIFGKDKLVFVEQFGLKPKDFVKLATISSPEDVIQLVPAQYRKGNANINLRGFSAGASYDLRETETIYEEKTVQKLPAMYSFVRKVIYADTKSGGLPADTPPADTTRQVPMPQELGGGTATVKWKVTDPRAELEKVKGLIDVLDPGPTWQGHLSVIWERLVQRAGNPTVNGNKAAFNYATGINVVVELKEYKGNRNVTGLKMEGTQLKGKSGTDNVFYDIELGGVTAWTINASFNSGVSVLLDSGGVIVKLPGDVQLLTLLPGSRLDAARSEIGPALDDLRAFRFILDAKRYLQEYWSEKLAPLAGTASVDGTSIRFKPAEDIRITFMPIKTYEMGASKTVTGLKLSSSGRLYNRFGSVTLFDNANYQGASLTVTDDIPDLGVQSFRDKASSIKMQDGGMVTLFSEVNYGERSESVTAIKAKYTGKTLEIAGASQADGGNAQVGAGSNGDNQKWILKKVDGNYYFIIAKHSGKYLEVANAGRDNRTNVHQSSGKNGDNQKWQIVDNGGYYNIKPKHSGKCLDVDGAVINGANNVQQFDCNNTDPQKWSLSLNEVRYSSMTSTRSDGWLGDFSLGSDTTRSVKVFFEAAPWSYTKWGLSRSLKAYGSVNLRYDEESADAKTVLAASLDGSENRFRISYDRDGRPDIKPVTPDGYEFPPSGWALFVRGKKEEIAGITDAARFMNSVRKSVVLPGGAEAAVNEKGGITATFNGVYVAPSSEGSSESMFALTAAGGANLVFNVSNTGGFGRAEIQGPERRVVPVYFDSSGVPQGIRYPVGNRQGGLFVDAHLNAGSRETVKLDLYVSGSIQTDGKFYFKGNSDLVIANFTVSQAEVSVSSDEGLHIKGVMDLYGAGTRIEGYLKPNGEFSFTGIAQIMVSGTGVKGAITIDNGGLGINGGVYIANTEIFHRAFEIRDGKVSFTQNINAGFAGLDLTTWVRISGGVGAGVNGRAYLDLDIPVTIYGPTKWECGSVFGIQVCVPSQFGWTQVGSISQHHSQNFDLSVQATVIDIPMPVAKLRLDLVKPEVKVVW